MPEIWRRIAVPSDITLDRLHDILQIVMGWEDYHQHEFTVGGQRYTEKPESPEDGKEEGRFRLGELVNQENAVFEYLYDFGDSWLHHITLENKNYVPGPGERIIQFLAGRRTCPPEDVGGVSGYYKFCEDIRDSEHPVYSQYAKEHGKIYDPEIFDWRLIEMELWKYTRWSRIRQIKWEI